LCYNSSRKREVNNPGKERKISMAKKNIRERIEAIERELWLMEFKDHWDRKDWERRAELNKELNELRNKNK
jgi:uncharacterized protein YpiB (UPF0302 family)